MFLFVSIIYIIKLFIIKLFINKLDLNMKWFALAAVCCWTSAHAFVPSAGTWVVNDELNGKPGRGLAIDVQNHVLVMQMYAYEKNGQPTFYMGSGNLNNNAATIALNQYQGGRYLGSGDRSGTEAGSPGAFNVRFTSSTTGFIRLPGEAEKAISRFEFGYSRADANSIMGTWAFVGAVQGTNTTYTEVEDLYTNIGPSSADGAGVVVNKSLTFACEQQKAGQLSGLTLCIRLNAAGKTQRTYVIRWSLHDGEGDLADGSGRSLGAAFARRLIDGRSNGTGLLRNAEAEAAAAYSWDAEGVKRQFLDALNAY